METQTQNVDTIAPGASKSGEIVSHDAKPVAAQPAPQAAFTPNPNASMAENMIQMALHSGADLDRLQQLIDMRDREEAKSAKKAYRRAVAQARAEVGNIIKTKENNHTRSKYADLETILAAVVPALSRYGLSIYYRPFPAQQQNHQGLTMVMCHEDGYEEEMSDEFPLDAAGTGGKTNKTAIQAKGSTMSYGARYLLRLGFALSSGEDDDGNGGRNQQAQMVPPEKMAELQALIEKTGTRPESILGRYNIQSLEQLQPAAFKQVMDTLNKRVN
ncbi:ERF family protein [Thalassobius sp. Cn5-15]|uniref:ERF family protein n=1 Tax=Thalassobius sp. Cn5-15 TaxID=2917763 RepID=UPI001EF17AC9|nr:ERF family protein [Thalassobius sp. Cn5-15]MCG7492448.1 ERF family protein [Thalassobius sp. Cn5-15]